MKERPILFNGEMVRSILDGQKTQTRRPVKHIQMLGGPLGWCAAAAAQEPGFISIVGDYTRYCPFGQPGGQLWVRETSGIVTGNGHRRVYRADGDPMQTFYPEEKIIGMKWTPSIHMRRSTSRIQLEITGVRVERVQEINEASALAEGMAVGHMTAPTASSSYHTARQNFAQTWKDIYGNWGVNPWVWVVEFKRVKP